MQVTLHASDVGASGRFSGRFTDHTARFTRIAVTFLSAPLTAAMQISTLLHDIIDYMQVLLNKRAHAETKSRLVLTTSMAYLLVLLAPRHHGLRK